VRVLDEHRIDMSAIVVSAEHWIALKRSYQDFHNWEEKMYAYFYFEGFRHRVREKTAFSVVLCKDSFFDIEYAAQSLYNISKANRYHPNISISQARVSDYLKLADVVTRFVRLFSHEEVSKIKNLSIFHDPGDNKILNRLFR
jgi:hypothetical protein